MTVAVEFKLRATGLLMLDELKHFCPFLLIESVPRMNKEKPPVLLIIILKDHYAIIAMIA